MCVQLAVLLVLCQGTGFSGIHYSTSQAQVELSTARQLNQTINLIKSIALFSTSATAACPVHVVTMSRPETLFATIKERVDGWAPAFRDR